MVGAVRGIHTAVFISPLTAFGPFQVFSFWASYEFSVVLKALRYKSEGPGIASPLGIYSVAADISVCHGVDSASKNEYQDNPGGKGGRCLRVTTLPPSCAECLVIWSLNRPEPSGSHRPVIGIALPFYLLRVYIELHFITSNFTIHNIYLSPWTFY